MGARIPDNELILLDLCAACPLMVAAGQTLPSELCADHATRLKDHLAKIAAQLAGRRPTEKVTISFDGAVAFNDYVWRYPDFIQRAERAYAELSF